ncbi:MAG: hypothetical protein H7Y05_02985 [Steroidobacteraceae bacterium]|nr:hypothetical protein [Deltaproteobacteria bacterium]
MQAVHNVEISWEDLLTAFTNGGMERVYFLDRFTGEIFFISATDEGHEFQQQMEKNRGRFLEIPPFDYHIERQIMSGFVTSIEDPYLKNLLSASLAGKKPYGKIEDILSFFPQEEERLMFLKDQYLSSRLKVWLEENNLFTVDATTQDLMHPQD